MELTKAKFTTREIADSLGEKVGAVRTVAFRLFDRGEFDIEDNEFVFTAEQADKIEAIFKKESKKENRVLAIGNAQTLSVAQEIIESNENNSQSKELKVIKQEIILGQDFKIYGDFDNPLFLAKDVAKWIEHSDVSTMLRSVDEDEKVTNIVRTLGGNQKAWFLTESGLYEVLMLSRKPIAKDFKKEVKRILHEVRTTGGYTVPKTFGEALQLAATQQVLIEQQQRQIEEQKPKAEYYDKICDATNLTEIGTVGKNLGIGDKKFFDVLRNDKIIYKKCDSDGVTYYVAYYGYEKYFGSVQTPFGKDGKNLVRNKLMFNQQGVIWANKRYRIGAVK